MLDQATQMAVNEIAARVEQNPGVGGFAVDVRHLLSLLDASWQENAQLRGALERIAAMTDGDDSESYRADDREGCLDTVYSTARKTLESA